MPDNPTNPEKAASEVKAKPDAGRTMTAEVNDAMTRNNVNTRAADQRLSAALEQKGVLPALILEGLAAGGSGRREDIAKVAATTPTRPGEGANTVAAIGALAKFDEIDANHDGSITTGEVTNWQQALQKTPEQLRYPDGSRLQHQADGTYQIVNRDGTNNGKPIDAANVRPDGSVVQEKADSGEPTKIKSADGSTITLAKQSDGAYHATAVESATGTNLKITYGADGSKSVTEYRATLGVPVNPSILTRSGDTVDVDDATGAVKITTKAGRYTERDPNSTSRTYDHAPGSGTDTPPRLLRMTNSDGTSTTELCPRSTLSLRRQWHDDRLYRCQWNVLSKHGRSELDCTRWC
ncbi:MAG: hypothetical protein HYX67_09235 [Candidatus Melainabacteria bacterium]|nr:hypothetical protein [Candidatus Melainabacteria bacterium]